MNALNRKIIEILNGCECNGVSMFTDGPTIDTGEAAADIITFVNANISHFTPIQHKSDCATHNEPAMRNGFCNCKGA